MPRASLLLLQVVVVVLTGAGCPEPTCEVKSPIVDARAWSFVDPALDPLWPAPAEAATCDADDIQAQAFGTDEALEIDTRFGCGWATVSQPTLVDLKAGDDVQVRIFYFSQATFPADRAEVAIALDGDVISSTLVDIPTAADIIAPRITLERDVPAGRTALFHVGNHGDNSWNLIELSRFGQGPCPDPSVAGDQQQYAD